MKISIVSVCVNYCNELMHTYKYNKRVYSKHDYWIITTDKDKNTIDFCVDNNINYYTTNAFYENGVFNKARAINKLFQNKKEVLINDWILLTDADMICADILSFWENTQHSMSRLENTLYSAPREFILDDGTKKEPISSDKFYGFFQLFHKSHIIDKIDSGFLTEHSDCSFYDYLFKMSFTNFIELRPESTYYPNLIHLGNPGKDHKGRPFKVSS